MSLDRSLLFDRRVAVAVGLQVVGYAALLAVYPHSEPSAVVEALGRLPAVLLVPVALPALPALALTLVVGAALSLAGLPPESLPAILLARGDVVFLPCSYLVGVVAAWAAERRPG